MESKKLAAFYCKRMIPLSDEKSNTNFSSSDSLGLGKINIFYVKKKKYLHFNNNVIFIFFT